MNNYKNVLVGSISVYILANFAWWMQPQILSSLISGMDIEQSTAGAVVAVELIAIAMASFSMAYYLDRYDLRRSAYIMGALSIVAHFFCAFSDAYITIVVLCLIAGVAEGVLLAIANAVIAGAKDSERSYSLMNVACVFSGFVILALAPFAAEAFSYRGVFAWLALAGAFAIPFFKLIPRQIERTSMVAADGFSVRDGKSRIGLILLLVGMFIWGTASGSVWAFFVVFGERTSLDSAVVGFVSSMAAVGGLVGGLVMTKMSLILPRAVSIVMGLIFQSSMALFLSNSSNNWVFMICAPAVLAGVYYVLPYFLGIAAQLDRSGSYPAAVCGMFVLTGGTGGLYGGLMVDQFGLSAIGWSVLFGCILAFLALHLCVTIVKDKAQLNADLVSC